MEIDASLIALQLVTGIALGAVYALLAIGLSLIFGMLTVVNEGRSFEAYRLSWLIGLHAFEEKRQPYLLYPVQRMP